MPRKRKQTQGQQKSKSQDSFQERVNSKQPVKQKRNSRIQGDENKILNEDFEETIFYDETSSQQVFNRQDESKPANQQSLPSKNVNAMKVQSNLIQISNNYIPRKTRNSANKIVEKEDESIIDEEEVMKESYQESNTDAQILINQEKLKKIFSTNNNLIKLKESYDSELIDHQHFQQSNNKGISKYGNKRGRKKTNEKDHYLPLEDNELMEELHQILLEYEYNLRDRSQNFNLLQQQQFDFESQNVVKKELEESEKQNIFDKSNKEQILSQRIQNEQLNLSNHYHDQQNCENKHYSLQNNSNILIQFETGQNFIPQQPIYNKQNINQIQWTGDQNIGDLSNINELDQSNKLFPNVIVNNYQNQQGRDLNSQNNQLCNKICLTQNKNSNSADSQDHVLIFNKYNQNNLDNTKQQSYEIQEDFDQKIQPHNQQNKNICDFLNQSQSILGVKISPDNSYIFNQGMADQSIQKNSSQMIDEDAETISTPTIKNLQQLEQQAQLQKFIKNKNNSEIKQSRSYKLAEDIKIIYIMSQKKNKINGYSSKYWGLVVRLNLIQRPHESLRDRYKRFIKYLNRDNIIDIIKWVRKNNKIEGYLNFIKFKNNFKMFSHVSYEDPFASKKQLFSGHRVQDARKKKSGSIESQSQNESDDQSLKNEEKQEGKAELNSENYFQQQQSFRSENQDTVFSSGFQLKENHNYFQQQLNQKLTLNANLQQQQSPKIANNCKKSGFNKKDILKGCQSPSTYQNSQISLYSPEICLKNETYSVSCNNKEIINSNKPKQKEEEENIFETTNFQFNNSCFINGERLFIILSEADSNEDLYNEPYLKDTSQIQLKQDIDDMSLLQNLNESEVINNNNQILPSNFMGDNSMNLLESEIIKKEEEQNCEQENSFGKQSSPQDQVVDQSQIFHQHSSYQIQSSNQKVSVNNMNESFNSRCHLQEIEQLNRCDYYNNENDSNSFQQLYNKMVSQNNELNVQSKDFHSMDIEIDQSQILL
ncbi:hypothetical protein ABPG72_003243 [Tetrahymena utriculariae]